MGYNFRINYSDYSWLNIDTSQTLERDSELKKNFTNYITNIIESQQNLNLTLVYPKITNKGFEKKTPSLLKVLLNIIIHYH
jgi:hypothetical protein